MADKEPLVIGETYIVKYPFVREKVELFDGEAPYETLTWRPGTVRGNDDYDYSYYRSADAHGEMLLCVVSIHRPGKYPSRVFYTRQWKDPDGRVFGKSNLRITAESHFRHMLKGYRHQYEICDTESA